MDNQQGEAPHMSSIPKRPSQPTGGKQSISKRSFSAHRSIESNSTGNLEQQSSSSSSLPNHKHDSTQSKQSKEEDNRSLLSEMATIKSVTVQPQTAESLRPPRSPERKKGAIQYTAAVNPGRARKQGFLVWVVSFGFLNLKSM
jgi:hypothetical protein